MHNGEKLYCIRYQELGSRLGAEKRCSTLAALKVSQDESHGMIEQIQRNSTPGALGH